MNWKKFWRTGAALVTGGASEIGKFTYDAATGGFDYAKEELKNTVNDFIPEKTQEKLRKIQNFFLDAFDYVNCLNPVFLIGKLTNQDWLMNLSTGGLYYLKNELRALNNYVFGTDTDEEANPTDHIITYTNTEAVFSFLDIDIQEYLDEHVAAWKTCLQMVRQFPDFYGTTQAKADAMTEDEASDLFYKKEGWKPYCSKGVIDDIVEQWYGDGGTGEGITFRFVNKGIIRRCRFLNNEFGFYTDEYKKLVMNIWKIDDMDLMSETNAVPNCYFVRDFFKMDRMYYTSNEKGIVVSTSSTGGTRDEIILDYIYSKTCLDVYAKSIKENIKSGYYYNGEFYYDAAHTSQMSGSNGSYYRDKDTKVLYIYDGSSYNTVDESSLNIYNGAVVTGYYLIPYAYDNGTRGKYLKMYASNFKVPNSGASIYTDHPSLPYKTTTEAYNILHYFFERESYTSGMDWQEANHVSVDAENPTKEVRGNDYVGMTYENHSFLTLSEVRNYITQYAIPLIQYYQYKGYTVTPIYSSSHAQQFTNTDQPFQNNFLSEKPVTDYNERTGLHFKGDEKKNGYYDIIPYKYITGFVISWGDKDTEVAESE
jgi:hypothetical protein